MTRDATLARLREYMVGPTRFMNLLSCFELGIVDTLRDGPGRTAAEIGATVGAAPDVVEQLLQLMVREGFVSCGEDGYALGALGETGENDLKRVSDYMTLIKVAALRQLFWLTESVQSGAVVGLRELYGHDGTLYAAVEKHKDLRDAFATAMDKVTVRIDPWFFSQVDVPEGARVLDLAGHTGLGAIHTYREKASPGLTVTTFDLPEKEAECRENFREHGVAEHCSFLGGDVFEEVPGGFDVVLIKHFLDMWDRDEVLAILGNARAALNPGGQVHVLVPVYPEDIRDPDNYNVDFFPTFFLGGTMGQGGPQKLSTYRTWLEDSGFTVTRAVAKDPAEIPSDVIPVPAVLSATKAV